VRARDRSPLSQREREIVALVAQGYKNKEMAEKLFHQRADGQEPSAQYLRQARVSDRLELALYAIHKGLQGDEER